MNGWFWTTIAFSSAVFLGSMIFIATVPAGTTGEFRSATRPYRQCSVRLIRLNYSVPASSSATCAAV